MIHVVLSVPFPSKVSFFPVTPRVFWKREYVPSPRVMVSPLAAALTASSKVGYSFSPIHALPPTDSANALGVIENTNTNANRHERTPFIFVFLFIAFQAQAPNSS